MAINVEMFKRIAEQIEAHPELHRQEDYACETKCGTAHCVAGWAIHFWGIDNGLTSETSNYGVRMTYTASTYGEGARTLDSNEIGEEILGLTYDQKCDLFYNMDNADALRMVKEYAAGKTDVHSGASYETDCECDTCLQ